MPPGPASGPLPDRARHRAAQPGRGPGHRVRVRRRLPGPRRRADRGLRPPQHHGGPGHRGPVARSGRPRARTLLLSGLLAGAPAVLGAWIGASAFNPSVAALLFGAGAGAIAQVIVQLMRQVRVGGRPRAHPGRRHGHAARARGHVRHGAAGERLMAARGHTRNPSRTTRRRSGRSRGAATSRCPRRRSPSGSSVSAASASAMVKRLERAGARRRTSPTRASSLTPAGRAGGARGASATTACSSSTWPRRSACPGTACTTRPRCSSTSSREELEELIAAKLGNPTHDPHGDPIPTARARDRRAADARAGRARARRRAACSCASRTRIPRCCATSRAAGSRPATRFEVIDKQPFDGPLFVRFGDDVHVLGGALARAMRAEVTRVTARRAAAVPSRRPRPSAGRASELSGARPPARRAGPARARRSSPRSPTSTPATSPPTSPAAPSTATCCCGCCSPPT